MAKIVEDAYAPHLRDFLEENWSSFVDKLAENYDEEAEDIAEEIVSRLA